MDKVMVTSCVNTPLQRYSQSHRTACHRTERSLGEGGRSVRWFPLMFWELYQANQ